MISWRRSGITLSDVDPADRYAKQDGTNASGCCDTTDLADYKDYFQHRGHLLRSREPRQRGKNHSLEVNVAGCRIRNFT